MYCTECGTQATGKFCHHCGARLYTGVNALPVDDHAELETIPLAEILIVDWTQETNYRDLIEHEVVRGRIAAAGRQYHETLSGEDILALFDAISPTGVPLEKLCRVMAPLYEKMGIRTGKQARTVFAAAPGRVLAGILCALASAGQTIKNVEQATDGCVLTATIPSDVWSLAGELVVSIHFAQQHVVVEAATKIPGQLYDWGKSVRLLDRLFVQSRAFAA